MYVVAVTGSRAHSDPSLIEWVLDAHYVAHRPIVVLVGDCPTGADEHVTTWARRMRDEGYRVGIQVFAADWDTHGRKAGPMRNKEIIDRRPDLLLAFHEPGAANIGTSGCVKLARAAGIRVVEYGRESQSQPQQEQETLDL